MVLLQLSALRSGFVLPGVFRAALGIKQEENKTEMDKPNHREWTQSAQYIKYLRYWKMQTNKLGAMSEIG